MWLRFGKWLALGIHFGSQNRGGDVPARHVIHAAIRLGAREWSHGPSPTVTHLPNPSFIPTPPVQRHPEAELETTQRLWR